MTRDKRRSIKSKTVSVQTCQPKALKLNERGQKLTGQETEPPKSNHRIGEYINHA